MEQEQKRKLENELMTLGLASLKDPQLVQQFAALISHYPGDKHRFLEDALNECDGRDRYEMYHAITPHLNFKALPLDTYEARTASRASEMVSKGWMRTEGKRPCIEIAGEQHEVIGHDDPKAVPVLTMRCGCKKVMHYVSTTPVDCMMMARKDGWVRNPFQKEECKACVQKELLARKKLEKARGKLVVANAV